nr:negative cofactor 2 complex subunit beta [Quercus suber]
MDDIFQASANPYSDSLPKATVQKIITEVLQQTSAKNATADSSGSGFNFAKETRDLLIECCVEFITMLSSEANEIAERDAKKTIACEHITKALDDLGFGEYVPELLKVADSFKSSQAKSSTLPSLEMVDTDGVGLMTLEYFRSKEFWAFIQELQYTHGSIARLRVLSPPYLPITVSRLVLDSSSVASKRASRTQRIIADANHLPVLLNCIHDHTGDGYVSIPWVTRSQSAILRREYPETQSVFSQTCLHH